MILAMVVSLVLVSSTILVHYEALRLVSIALPRLTVVRPRARIVFVMFAAFGAHTVEVYLYAIAYWLLEEHYGFGNVVLHGTPPQALDFVDLVYFSTITYTSVGFGDVVPLGGLRLITGVEALNGLLMIAWSASYTFLCMQDLWPLHVRRTKTPPGHHRR
ncbi:MAG: two pore domain potassium channel family protein [Alphaproteobacteria bacterium]|nr:two pore domain potassium channel family protein [Alphaproteobacteria bacterium]